MGVVESWGHEKESAFLYRVLAEAEPSPRRRELFARLADEAETQALIWEDKARGDGIPTPPTFAPTRRARVVAAMVRRFGVERMRGILAAMKVRGMSIYAATQPGHAMPTSVEEVGRRHHGSGRGSLRAAVFGVNDGLVSNASLILGVAGATGVGGGERLIVVSGVAGLLAGAFSMAAGEYISIRSQREMFERQISAERDELSEYPKEEAAELALIYEARGIEKKDADRLSKQLIANPQHALDTLAREELGLDPAELGSPWTAALSSAASFSIGALLPLAPFLLFAGRAALVGAVAATGGALFTAGVVTSLFTGKGALVGGLRMLLIGAAAATVTFFIGRLLGVAA
ncbi:MAG TPA: VIT1/CCC1 transporter family protein [Polyangia bacterium]|nr:VIT1/CCC1 transporter family protein [Polyangia bacterium]